MCFPQQAKPVPVDFQEAMFQRGIRGTPWFSEFKSEYGEEPNLDAPEYDYRGAWKEGVRPERDVYDPSLAQVMTAQMRGSAPAGRHHWSSVGKSEDHPTMWKEKFMQLDGRDPDSLGLPDAQAASRYLLRSQ
jgi:hypothetical protein